MRAGLTLALLCFGLTAQADEVSICYNYDCAVTAKVNLRGNERRAARRLLLRATDAVEEREAISHVIGLFEVAAGRQTPTWADKGGNVDDDGVDGRMDCIDESANTTSYLRLLESKGWLKYHLVLEPVKRAPLLVNDHWAARIVEKKTGREFAVDSWFFDNGQPAFVVPLDEWLAGAEPNEE
ncbi:MAG: hypothetical protein AUK53_09125 [Betaproteobacteria bacterium CG2_30_59_46]|nr:MAG: hypothetical protein AUK53_09125 [Betaproteobacteria bacterium CG2_30_59_46]PIQ13052.1 MAG: hypothetical protein COW70_06745 [Hydrogenophilales bacterium CG18_big_fil_WC_8_21_14_2_50_58_12]PIY01135.1 MAG: hypothetical protein COZ23_04740 [Hydrogenophilales bacterium CG_4_10_14_3_um_filter_58_23]PJB04796.1 MAG: hypothetical protein CO125_10770 [Hydrogenophilales bacterium CG_4_9_14_3_um_filter_59_35]